jgi:hypothetical protein
MNPITAVFTNPQTGRDSRAVEKLEYLAPDLVEQIACEGQGQRACERLAELAGRVANSDALDEHEREELLVFLHALRELWIQLNSVSWPGFR